MEDIFWGNLYKNQEDLANEIPDNFKKVSEYFSVDEFIFPDIDESKEEIELLINSIELEQKSKTSVYKEMDKDLFDYFKVLGKELGIKSKDSIDAIEFIKSNISPLTLDLKRYWNRARPYQYGYLLDLPIHPLHSKSGTNTPCYPSGHSLQAIAFNKILSKKYPNLSVRLDEMESQVHQSRMALGVHFPSDINFSIEIGEYLTINGLLM